MSIINENIQSIDSELYTELGLIISVQQNLSDLYVLVVWFLPRVHNVGQDGHQLTGQDGHLCSSCPILT